MHANISAEQKVPHITIITTAMLAIIMFNFLQREGAHQQHQVAHTSIA
eukprot:COSAG01_NODE_487_length_16389_cov_19.482014_10_plen_48_part_00